MPRPKNLPKIEELTDPDRQDLLALASIGQQLESFARIVSVRASEYVREVGRAIAAADPHARRRHARDAGRIAGTLIAQLHADYEAMDEAVGEVPWLAEHRAILEGVEPPGLLESGQLTIADARRDATRELAEHESLIPPSGHPDA